MQVSRGRFIKVLSAVKPYAKEDFKRCSTATLARLSCVQDDYFVTLTVKGGNANDGNDTTAFIKIGTGRCKKDECYHFTIDGMLKLARADKSKDLDINEEWERNALLLNSTNDDIPEYPEKQGIQAIPDGLLMSDTWQSIKPAIDYVMPWAEKAYERPALVRVYFKRQPRDAMDIVAANGYCLGKAVIEQPARLGGLSSILVPHHWFAIIDKLVEPADTIAILRSGEYNIVTADNVTIMGKDGGFTYPDYAAIIRTRQNYSYHIHGADTLNALSKLEPFLKKANNMAIINLQENTVTANVKGNDAQVAKSCFTLMGKDTFDGTFAINYQYLVGVLKSAESGAILGMSDPSSPLVFTTETPNWVTVIMPMHIGR